MKSAARIAPLPSSLRSVCAVIARVPATGPIAPGAGFCRPLRRCVPALLFAVTLATGCTRAPAPATPPPVTTAPESAPSPTLAPAPAPASTPAPTVGTRIDDTVVTARVKAALIADASTRGHEIQVETYKGEVLLSGFVDSPERSAHAESIARAIDGVAAVDNRLTVKPAPATIGNKVDDGIITARVKAELVADNAMKGLDIAVATHKGVVQLSGFVDADAQIARATELARNVEGVHQVKNDLKPRR